jgi:hypothetical protein
MALYMRPNSSDRMRTIKTLQNVEKQRIPGHEGSVDPRQQRSRATVGHWRQTQEHLIGSIRDSFH